VRLGGGRSIGDGDMFVDTDPPGVLCQVEMVLSYRWV
jgi:hypothetical protein